MHKSSLLAIALAWTLCGSAVAQRGEETIVLLPEGVDLPSVVTDAIVLPKDENGEYIASEEGVAHSAEGFRTANAAREGGRAFGEEMAAAARENRENHTRGELPNLGDVRPEHVPDDATLPTLPPLPDRPSRPEIPGSPTPTPPSAH